MDEVLEALEIIDRYDTQKASTAYTLTGGAITSKVAGRDEADFYGHYAKAIEERFPGRWIGKGRGRRRCPRRTCSGSRTTACRSTHPNFEVWDRRLFELYCPGDGRYVGRDEWHRRILDSAEVFGARNVIPNFVAGVEMAEPFGFTSVDEAIASTTEGLRFFMSHGITPRFTTWCPEPTTPLGKANPQGAPLGTTSGCSRPTGRRWTTSACPPRPATARPAPAARCSPSAPSWTACPRTKRRTKLAGAATDGPADGPARPAGGVRAGVSRTASASVPEAGAGGPARDARPRRHGG